MAFGRKNKNNTPATEPAAEQNNLDPEEMDPFLEQKKNSEEERELYVDEAVREEELAEGIDETAEEVAEELSEPADFAEETVAEATDPESPGMTDFADEGLTEPDDDFEFVSEETVLDKSMTADPVEVEKGTPRAKTDRRNADTTDRKRAKMARNRKRRGPTIIVIIIIIAVLAFIGFKFYQNKMDEKKAEEVAEEQLEQEELIVDENVSALITNYYSACASGEIAVLDTYAENVTDLEKDLIKTKSEYIESYNDILCQRSDGPEEDSYLVTVTDHVKYAGTEIEDPEVSVFYIKKNAEGIYLIENAYGEFNRTNHVTQTDPQVEQAINDFINGDAVKALQADVLEEQQAAAADETFAAAKKAIDDAVAKWLTDNDAAIKSAAASAAGGADATVDAAAEADNAAVEEAPAEEAPAEEAPAETVEEQTEDLPDTVYATEAVRIRTEQDMEADYVTTVYPGDPLDVVGYTDGWYHVKSGDSEGYVNEEYVSTSQD
ncbi:MAG: SH3 domain-containing protein [Lachnospiraceae bacterium]|nr:SH3 domain-containing protein [Lachnospiraceae bacterium]